ncbi:MAG: TlpA family protein disulfide reductase [Planctomycetes bacterium]|nr:TlpA family protein disulfide reductase [Planctomycetota bacterium]
MKIKRLYGSAVVVLLCYLTVAGAAPPGILNQQGPSWDVTRWYNLPDGQKNLDLKDLQDKVVYLYCFQSWCPGCHRYGFPTLRKLIDHYQGKNQDIEFVAVQTAFEGFGSNSETNAKQTADRYKLKIPVGHSGSAIQRSALMRRYRTGGTPWAIVIDRTGKVRYNDFHITPDQAIALIDNLLQEKGPVVVNQDSAKKARVGFTIKLHGVEPHYPVRAIEGRQLNTNHSIFYIEKTDVSGTLNLIIYESNLKNVQWAKKKDWLKYFVFGGLSHYIPPIRGPTIISPSQLLLKWDDPVVAEESKNTLLITAKFTVRKRDGEKLKPGLYRFLTSGFTKDAPFLAHKYPAFDFSVSHLKTTHDHVNWHLSQGDKLSRINWSKTITDPLQAGRKRIESLEKAFDEYSKCLEYIPDDDVVILAIADNLEQRGLPSEAIEFYDKAINLWTKNKGLVKVRAWRSGLDIRQNNWEVFLRAVQLHRDKLADHIAGSSDADK